MIYRSIISKEGGIVIMLSCLWDRMTFSFLFGMLFMLGWLWSSPDVQAQTTGGQPAIQKKWTFTTKDRVFGQPVPAGDAVYLNTFNDQLIALDAATGRLRWTFDPWDGKGYPAADFWEESGTFLPPAVLGDQVFFASHNGMYAVDAKTGARKWRFVLDKRLPSKPVASDGKVFFGTVEGEMCAVDAATGFKKWNMNVAGLVASGASPTLGAGVVFFASPFGPSVNALDLESGRQRWQWKDADEPFCESTIIVSVGYRMYLGAGKCGKLFAFESLTGKLAWDVQLPSLEGDTLAVLNDAALETVLVSGANGMLYAFSAATGIEKWRASMGSHQGWYVRPKIAKGTVYYLWNGNLNAVEEDSGKPKWRVRLDSLQQSSSNYASTSDHKSLYLADGTLYLIGPDDSLAAYSMQ